MENMEDNGTESFLILPLLAISFHEDGLKQFTFGWFNKTYWISWR